MSVGNAEVQADWVRRILGVTVPRPGSAPPPNASAAVVVGSEGAADAPRLAALAKVDAALAGLAQKNTRIPDDRLQQAAATKLAELTRRRGELTSDTVDWQTKSDALAGTLGAASAYSSHCIAFGTASSKKRRNEIRSASAVYLAEGKKAYDQTLGRKLVLLATTMASELTNAEDQSVDNPKAAREAVLKVKYSEVKRFYRESILAPPLTRKVEELLQSNPNGPEAQMQQALGEKEFQERLLDAYVQAKSLGSPQIELLTPGEAVAIYSYTTSDYDNMNGLLLGLTVPKDDDQKKKTHLKISAAEEALAKLPPYLGQTKRGEMKWPGDDQQYTKDNVFTVNAFWSTAVGVSFLGDWDITIDGKTGKDVAVMSAAPDETEVLFPPGTKFRVKSVDKGRQGGGRVLVEEI